MNSENLMNIERINEAKIIFAIDESVTLIHYGPIIGENLPFAIWCSDFVEFIKFLKNVKPRIIHLDESDGLSGWAVNLQFVENLVLYGFQWESEDYVEPLDQEVVEDDEHFPSASDFASNFSVSSFSDQFEIIEKVRNAIDTSDIKERIIESVSCYGPKKVMDRRTATAFFLEDVLGEKFPGFDWQSNVWHLYLSVADALENRHNSAEKAFLGILGDLHKEIRVAELDWDTWTVAGKKKVAASWLKESYGFESTAISHELASYRARK
jgi:hypothetical protein